MKYHSGQDFFRFHNLIRPVAPSAAPWPSAKQAGVETMDHPGLRVQPVTRRRPPSVTRAKYRTDPGVDMLSGEILVPSPKTILLNSRQNAVFSGKKGFPSVVIIQMISYPWIGPTHAIPRLPMLNPWSMIHFIGGSLWLWYLTPSSINRNNNMELFLMLVKQISTHLHWPSILFNFERMFAQRKLVFPWRGQKSNIDIISSPN